MHGTGYRAQVQGDVLNLMLGFSHPVVYKMPVGIKCETLSQTEILIKRVDKHADRQLFAGLFQAGHHLPAIPGLTAAILFD